MQFKHPELLYALFLLLIPIIVHLFQFRKFHKEDFTNVSFLKAVILQTRKSSQLKKWLTLFTRLLFLATVIIAFAQPYSNPTKQQTLNTKTETVIYLDNSYSMQAKGRQGELLKRAVQDIISNVPEYETISLVTNDAVYKNTTIKALKNSLLQLDYSSKHISYHAALLKCKKLFKPSSTLKNIVFVSDFQQQEPDFKPEEDSLYKIYAVKLKPVDHNNIAVDSAYISKAVGNTIELKVSLKNQGEYIENLPVSLFNNGQLIAKTSATFGKDTTTTFSLPSGKVINGKLSIDSPDLQYDNSLFFNINTTSKIKVLVINNGHDSFLKRIYTTDEFNYTATSINALDYNIINQQNLIVLNELHAIPYTLISVLNAFTKQGGYLIIIPGNNITTDSYNTLLKTYHVTFGDFIDHEKQITTINYSNPLYSNGVFEKRVSNFQYPTVKSYYNTSYTGNNVLQFEDNKPFLLQGDQVFVFTAPLSETNSNFINSPLIVPTLYNIGKLSLKFPELYYIIGKENIYDIPIELGQDYILSLQNKTVNLIPQQRYFNNKVEILTNDEPSIAGIYTVKDNDKNIQNISYNYDRGESNLVYQDISNIKNIHLSNSINNIFDVLKRDSKINELWKWFVIFALAFLIIEMLILKYFK